MQLLVTLISKFFSKYFSNLFMLGIHIFWKFPLQQVFVGVLGPSKIGPIHHLNEHNYRINC